ncbi:MAG: PLP-dependent aminotransferase family protein [bacterium]|nr:PLP-dependent aminotransferase family protein [bacterium]
MQDFLFQIQRSKSVSLQTQIREVLVSAILAGHLPAGERIPSTREMAKSLGVSRNTVLLTYLDLADDGYLEVKNRSGYYVNGAILKGYAAHPVIAYEQDNSSEWKAKFRIRPKKQDNIQKPIDWRNYRYPFIYGQIDHKHFPMAEWRECQRQALSEKSFDVWTRDARDQDDEMLVEQIRTRLLPRRGIMASQDEILVTLGAQNSIYIIASLLVGPQTKVGFEDPGYPDARNIFALKTDRIIPIPIDDSGLVINNRLDGCDLLFVTPSHQFPTTVTLSRERRTDLIKLAIEKDMIIVEDDYEFETNYMKEPTPALKSLDVGNKVIYVGSLSKSLFPGLRMGYLVGPREFIEEARALRRLMFRHPPSNNQHTTALFLALGYHDSLLLRSNRAYRERWHEMGQALKDFLPNSSRVPSFGGSSYWICGREGLDAETLEIAAREKSVIIEPGRVYFNSPKPPGNYFRLGFSSIRKSRIRPGIEIISDLIDKQMQT